MKTNRIFKLFGVAICVFLLAFLISGCGCSKNEEPKATQSTSFEADTTEPTQQATANSTSNEAEINYFDLE